MTPEHDNTPAAAALHRAGWRLLLGGAYSSVAVGSMAAAVDPEGNEVCICTWQDRD